MFGCDVVKPPRSITHLSTNRDIDNYFVENTKKIAVFSLKNDKERLIVAPEIKDLSKITKKVNSLEKIVSKLLSDLGILTTHFQPKIIRKSRKATINKQNLSPK